MRRVIFSGVALAALATSVIAPAHARAVLQGSRGLGHPPGVTQPTPTCETTSQCYTFGNNGLTPLQARSVKQAKPH